MADTEFIDKLEQALKKLVELEIKTVVTGVPGDGGAANGAAAITTVLNLVDGDITTTIDKAFVTGDYKALMDFHATREKQAADIIKSNLETLQKLIAYFREGGGSQGGTSGAPGGTS